MATRGKTNDRDRARRWSSGSKPSGVVSLLSDFGDSDPYAGIMSGVILGIAPEAQLVNLTHLIPPQAVEIGSLLLRSAVEYFPDRSIHLAVVDPGVGSDRSPILAVADRGVLVGPDNGLLHASAVALGLREVRRIEADEYFLKPVSNTFHGRDVFAPVAGHLAAGRAPESFGPVVAEMKTLDALAPDDDGHKVSGQVLYVDRFGNLITNIAVEDLGTPDVSIEIGDRRLQGISSSYASSVAGDLLAICGSWGMLEVARCNGNAARTLGVGRGEAVVVAREQV